MFTRTTGSVVFAVTLALLCAGCPGKRGDKGKDAAVDVAPAGKDLGKGKDLNKAKDMWGKDAPVDVAPVKPDKAKQVDLPAVKDLYSMSGEWMLCYGSSGYDNTCDNYKTGFKCCRGKYPSGANACPPGLVCGHYDCFGMPDMDIKSRPCAVGKYCVSPLRCWCKPSKGWCGACDYCSSSCKLLPKCPVKP